MTEDPTTPPGSDEPASELPPIPPPPPRPTISPKGWSTALTRSLLAFAIMLLAGELVAFLAVADTDLASSEVVKIGGMAFFSVHHVGVQTSVSDLDVGGLLGGLGGATGDLPAAGGIDATVTLSIAALAFTLLAAWLLYRGGRAAAEAGGGTPMGRVLVGASVGVPYALLALGLSFLLEFKFAAGPVGGVTVGVSTLGALLWPLGLGYVFGGLGGLSTARDDLAASQAGARWIALFAGAGRMLRWGLIVSSAGLLVLAAASPDVTREYFSGIADAGAFDGFRLVFFTAVIGAPLLAVNGLLGGMLVPIVVGEYLSTSSITLISLIRFPKGGAALEGLNPLAAVGGQPGVPYETGIARPEYFVFVVAALVAVILGGRYAARRAGAAGAGSGAAYGAGAGAVFAVAAIFLAVLGSIGFKAEVDLGIIQQTVLGQLGPNLIYAGLLALAWGVIGGAIGGALGAGKAQSERPGIAPGPSQIPAD